MDSPELLNRGGDISEDPPLPRRERICLRIADCYILLNTIEHYSFIDSEDEVGRTQFIEFFTRRRRYIIETIYSVLLFVISVISVNQTAEYTVDELGTIIFVISDSKLIRIDVLS